MTTAVVIVTHGSDRSLPGLLEDLAQFEPQSPVVVVDSGSSSVPSVPDHVELVSLVDNVGFGAASNRGARRLLKDASFEHVAFLNPDVRLFGPSLSELSEQLSGRSGVGIATGPVVNEHGERVPSAWGPTSAVRAFWFATGWKYQRLRPLVGRALRGGTFTSSASLVEDDMVVDGHVLGGAMVVRRRCFEQIDGFDEGFFLYWEDADLCHRARRTGWQVAVLPCTPISHRQGTSSDGISDEQRRTWYVEGARRFAQRHLTDNQQRRLRLALATGFAVRRGDSILRRLHRIRRYGA